MFRVFTTKEFNEWFEYLDESEKKKLRKIMNHIREKGDSIGKLLGRKYFREKKFGGKRLYFLVYKKFMVILGVGISNKKTQQNTIDKILSEIRNYEKFIIEKLRGKS